MTVSLPTKTEYIRVRRYRLVVTAEMDAKFKQNIAIINDLHQYAVKYLEKTYGYKHLGRSYPSTRTDKLYVIKDEIEKRYLKERYPELKRWDLKKIGLH